LAKMQEAEEATLEAEAAANEAAMLAAEEAAKADAAAADNAAAVLEAELRAAGLDAEADEIKRLREALHGGHMTGAELEVASKDAHALAERLRGMDTIPSAQHMAADAEDLGDKLGVAARAKLEAEILEKQMEAEKDLKEAAEIGHKVADELRELGFAEDAQEVERLTNICEDVMAGKVKGEELDQAIVDCDAEIANLRAQGLNEQADQLEVMRDKMQSARAAELEVEAAEQEAALLKAEEEAKADAAAAANEAAVLEAELRAAGLDAEADEIKRLREALEGGKMTGAELEKASTDAHSLADKLRGMDNIPSAQHLASDADELGVKLGVAAKAKLEAEVLEKQMEAAEDLKAAASEAQALADELRTMGLEEDAIEVERIGGVCLDIAAGKLSGNDLDNAVADCKIEIEKLRKGGHEKQAKKLEHIMEKMQAARAAALEAEAAQEEAALLAAAEEVAALEGEAANQAVVLEAELRAAGLDAEADEIKRLREKLKDGTMTGPELEVASKDAHALGDKLKGMNEIPTAQHMAKEAHLLGDKLGEAANAKLEQEMLEQQKEAAQDLKEAMIEAQAVAVQLRADGLDEDALEVERLIALLDDVLKGKVGGLELDQGIEDCRAEITKLELMDQTELAGKLGNVLVKMEKARESQMAAQLAKSEIEMRKAEEEAAKAEEAAGNMAAQVEADLLAAGLGDEATKIHEMREALEDPATTGNQLEEYSKEAVEMSKELHDKGLFELSSEVDTLSDLLKDAAKAKLMAQAAELQAEAMQDLEKAVHAGRRIEGSLRAANLGADADEVAGIHHLCNEVLVKSSKKDLQDKDKLKGDELETAEQQGNQLAEKLKGSGQEVLGDETAHMVEYIVLAKKAMEAQRAILEDLQSLVLDDDYDAELMKAIALARNAIEVLAKTGYKAESKQLSDLLDVILQDSVVTAAECESLRDDVYAMGYKMEAADKLREATQIFDLADQLDALWRASLQREAKRSQKEAQAYLEEAARNANTLAGEIEKDSPEEAAVLRKVGERATNLYTWTTGTFGEEVLALVSESKDVAIKLELDDKKKRHDEVEGMVVSKLIAASDADNEARSVIKTLEKKDAESAASKARAQVAEVAKQVARTLEASPNKECQSPVKDFKELGLKVGDGRMSGQEIDQAGEDVRGQTAEMLKGGFVAEAQAIDKLVVAVGAAAKAVIDVEVLETERQARAHIAEAKVLGETLARSMTKSGQAGAAHSVNKVLSHLQNATEGAFMVQVKMTGESDEFNKERFTSDLESRLKVKRGRLHTRAVRKYGDVKKANGAREVGNEYIRSKDMEPGQRSPSPAKQRASSPKRGSSPTRGGSPSKRAGSPMKGAPSPLKAQQEVTDLLEEDAAILGSKRPGSKAPTRRRK